jgi:hypothetical protein
MEKDPLMSISNTNDPVNNPSHYGGTGNIISLFSLLKHGDLIRTPISFRY